MIVPSQRMIGAAAVVALPAAAVAGLYPAMLGPCCVVLAVFAAIAAIDAILGEQRIAAIGVRTPPFLRFTKDVAGTVPLTVENSSDGTLALRLSVGSGEPVAVSVAKGASLVPHPVTPSERGDHQLPPVHFEAPSPLGLWQARATRHPAFTLRVYPNLRDRATAALFLKTANPGMRAYRQVGKGREFDNLRHYLSGDAFEDIHWRATARRGFPVVKLYRVEHAQEIYAVIDSSRLSMREGILESYVNASLHLALVAERQGDRFGLATFSDRTHSFVRARNGMDHFRLCRETIYNLRPERVSPSFRDIFTSLQLNVRRRSLIVFFTSLDDALLAETFEREVSLLARRHLVLVNVTRTPDMKELFTGDMPETIDGLYGSLAGQMLWNRMRTLAIALQNRGVKLAIVEPDRMKAEVTAQYLDVKRRQAL